VSCRLEFDDQSSVLRVTFSNTVTDEIFWAAYGRIAQVVKELAPKGGILDFSPATELKITTRLVKDLSMRKRLFPEEAVEVAVAPNDLIFGLSRMYQILKNRRDIYVVRNLNDAYTLLTLKSPEFRLLEDLPS
jgi:hypothetical protein